MKRGEVRWLRFNKAEKNRPVVILTRDSVIPVVNSVIIAERSSVIRGIPTEVLLGPEDGMPLPSAINLDRIQTMDKSRLGEWITDLTEKMHATIHALLVAVDGFAALR